MAYAIDKKEVKAAVAAAGKSPVKESLADVLRKLNTDPTSTAFYALDLKSLLLVPDNPGDLKEWYPAIKAQINKFNAGKHVSQLLVKLEEQGYELDDPEFWASYEKQWQKANEQRYIDLFRGYAPEFPLGAATITQLTELVGTKQLGGLSPKQIASFAGKAGLTVFPDATLPAEPLPKALQNPLKNALAQADYPTIFHVLLLHREDDAHAGDFRFMGEVKANGKRVAHDDVGKALERAGRASDTAALPKAKQLLAGLEKVSVSEFDTVIAQAVRFQAESELKSGPVARVRSNLVDKGYNLDDVTQLLVEIGPAPGVASGPSAGSILEALSERDLDEAERTASLIIETSKEAQEDPEIAAAIAQVKAAREAKTAAVAAYEQALKSRDYEAAARALHEALRDDADPDLEAKLDQLPPPPPAQLSASVTGTGSVKLAWPRSRNEADLYTLVRREGSPAKTPGDGAVVVTSAAVSEAEDQALPVATTVYYSLFAVRENGMYSDPITSTEISVVPPPTGVTVKATETELSVAWNRHPQASGTVVELRGPDGRAQRKELGSETSVVFGGLRTGTAYLIALSSTFLRSGGVVTSPAVTVEGTPRSKLTAVNDLAARPDAAGDFDLTWSQPVGFDLQMWAFPRSFELPRAKEMSMDSFRKMGGARLDLFGVSVDAAGRGRGRIAAPSDMIKIVPALVADQTVLLGLPVLIGVAPQPKEFQTQMLGDDLQVSFVWPEGNYTMEVTYQRNGVDETQKVSKVDYRRSSGVIIKRATEVSNIAVATIADVAGQRIRSNPVPVEFTAAAPTTDVQYNLATKKSLFGGKYTTTVRVSSLSGAPIGVLNATLKIKYGPVMPLDGQDGDPIAPVTFDLSSAPTAETKLELGKLNAPFWLHLATDDPGIRLVAPATQEMKVV